MIERPEVTLVRGGAVRYSDGLAWQRHTADALRAGAPGAGGREALALIEHEPVYTMGRRGGRSSLRVPPESLCAPVVDTDRGGDITWHGPGQLVGYPILHLRRRGLRAADYVRTLEAALIDVLAEFEVAGQVVPGRPGVWVGDAKVAAIGVAIRGGVSMHGFALNVSPDLSWFDAITPCGLADATVTSLAVLVPQPPSMGDVIEATRASLGRRLSSGFVAAPSPFVERVPA